MNKIYIVLTYILIIILLLIIFFYFTNKIYKMYSTNIFLIYLVSIFIFILSLFYIPINLNLLSTDNVHKYKDYNKLNEGRFTKVYLDKYNPNIVHKVLSMPDLSKIQDFEEYNCDSVSCPVSLVLLLKISVQFNWESIRRIYNEFNDIKYFPKIYEIDENNHTYVQEYIPLGLNNNTCPIDYKNQLNDLNQILKKKGYFLHDIHSINIRISKDGVIKIIDCDIYTEEEFLMHKNLIKLMYDLQSDGKECNFFKTKKVLNSTSQLFYFDDKYNETILNNCKR